MIPATPDLAPYTALQPAQSLDERNPSAGPAVRGSEALDLRLPELTGALDGGVLFLTGDHGCDPTTPSTDHSRENTPALAWGVPEGPHDLGVRPGFSDLGATIGELLGVDTSGLGGESFALDLGFER